MAKKPDEPKVSGKGKLPLGVDNPTLNSPGYASTAPISGEERSAATGGSSPRLSDEEVVGGRYRIVRYIARGGMGEVYEAEDLELGERVALKTIRAETKDRVAEERFKREIQLSRKVTHPNVCRIFDVGFHQRPDGVQIVFLTMELEHWSIGQVGGSHRLANRIM
ncbi:MAG: protein kinase [Roseiflexaceae bacterium]